MNESYLDGLALVTASEVMGITTKRLIGGACQEKAAMQVAIRSAFDKLLSAEQDSTPVWWRCEYHGQGGRKAWGCPSCTRELREENAKLRDELNLTKERRC